MYKLITILGVLLSASAIANEDKLNFDMEIQDGTLAQAVELVNGACESEIGTIEIAHPEKPLSLKFEEISCSEAAQLLTEYDSGKA